jgi:Domain of unknown function (DUF4440)
MRKTFAMLVLLAMVTSGCTVYPEKKAPSWTGATRSERFNQLFWENVATKNWSAVSDHVASLVVFKMGDQETSGKDQTIAALQSAGIDSVQIGDVQSQPAGADLVTTYTLTIAGKPPMHAMTVWQQAGRHWVIVAHSASTTSK